MYKKLTTKFCDYALFYLPLKRIFMRLIVILLVVGMHFSVFARAQKVTLNHKNAQLTTILNAIKQQTGYNFLYDAAVVERVNGLNLSLQNVPLDDALSSILEPYVLTFQKSNGVIVIQTGKRAIDTPNTHRTVQQYSVVTGKVNNEKGEPLVGLTVQIKG